jgi:hypothetical protein
MDKYQAARSNPNFRSPSGHQNQQRIASQNPEPKKTGGRSSISPANSLAVGAKTVAGVGVGLISVVVGSFVIGAVTEAVIIPSLLLKLAGGIAGGGIGMAKGLNDSK